MSGMGTDAYVTHHIESLLDCLRCLRQEVVRIVSVHKVGANGTRIVAF